MRRRRCSVAGTGACTYAVTRASINFEPVGASLHADGPGFRGLRIPGSDLPRQRLCRSRRASGDGRISSERSPACPRVGELRLDDRDRLVGRNAHRRRVGRDHRVGVRLGRGLRGRIGVGRLDRGCVRRDGRRRCRLRRRRCVAASSGMPRHRGSAARPGRPSRSPVPTGVRVPARDRGSMRSRGRHHRRSRVPRRGRPPEPRACGEASRRAATSLRTACSRATRRCAPRRAWCLGRSRPTSATTSSARSAIGSPGRACRTRDTSSTYLPSNASASSDSSAPTASPTAMRCSSISIGARAASWSVSASP